MYKRKIEYAITKWIEKESRKPLILRGARQVGKTTAVRNISKLFDVYVELNLDGDEDREIFELNRSFEDLISAIFFLKQQSQVNGKTLIFIDEIQNSPKAVKQLRYFYEKRPDLCVIAAGSLLESLIDNTISFPVGRVEYLYMYPFSFEEYLWAMDEGRYTEVLNQVPIPVFAHEVFLKAFSKYTLIGGMPEIVFDYLKNKDLVLLSTTYQSLITAYLDDVEKYAKTKKESAIIRFLIEKCFFETGKRIKFSGFGNSNYSGDDIKNGFLTLEKALITKLIYPTTKTELPIETDFKKSPKLLMLDIGMVNYFAGYQNEIFSSQDIGNVYHGLITEQVIAQELRAYSDNHLKRLHFWVRKKKQSNAEVDFVYQIDNLIIPIEVKTGKSGRLRSLHQFIDNCPHQYAVRIYSGKFEIQKTKTISGKEFLLLNLPFYLISKLEEYIRLMIPRD